MIRAIACPTDFSPEGQSAFVHALALALATRARLDLLHVRAAKAPADWSKFPRVREMLVRWGRLAAGASAAEVEPQTGVSVRKVEIDDADPLAGLADFMAHHAPDLVVMASHGKTGLASLGGDRVSTEVAHKTRLPVLLVGPRARGFADPASGAIALRRVLVPVARDPFPGVALQRLPLLLDRFDAQVECLHVGDGAYELPGHAVRTMPGAVEETILSEARGADLLAMPTAGRHGLLDALRGSTTERVLAHAPVPVLALPVAG